MQATTLPSQLKTDLWALLIEAGHSVDVAYEIVDLLPDRGHYELLEALNTGGLDLLLAQWIGDLAETMRCPAADAAHIRDLLNGVVR